MPSGMFIAKGPIVAHVAAAAVSHLEAMQMTPAGFGQDEADAALWILKEARASMGVTTIDHATDRRHMRIIRAVESLRSNGRFAPAAVVAQVARK